MLEDPCFKVSPQAIARGIEDLLDENERLNNIINEFKNYLSQTISKYEIEYDYDEGYYDCLVETNHYLNEFINDFKELKENK